MAVLHSYTLFYSALSVTFQLPPLHLLMMHRHTGLLQRHQQDRTSLTRSAALVKQASCGSVINSCEAEQREARTCVHSLIGV